MLDAAESVIGGRGGLRYMAQGPQEGSQELDKDGHEDREMEGTKGGRVQQTEGRGQGTGSRR